MNYVFYLFFNWVFLPRRRQRLFRQRCGFSDGGALSGHAALAVAALCVCFACNQHGKKEFPDRGHGRDEEIM
jgi:hypothetical protein